MQNSPSSPGSSRPDFNTSAAIPESTQIALRLHEMGATRATRQHEDLVKRQEQARAAKLQDLEKNRLDLVQSLSRQNLRRATESIHPELKPQYLPPDQQRVKERAAFQQAKVQVAEIERTAIKDMDAKFIRDQRDILNRAVSAHSRKQFNSEARKGLKQSFDHSQSQEKKGRSR